MHPGDPPIAGIFRDSQRNVQGEGAAFSIRFSVTLPI
jgi:hypothetical protein